MESSLASRGDKSRVFLINWSSVITSNPNSCNQKEIL
jgi:hypothetical protein